MRNGDVAAWWDVSLPLRLHRHRCTSSVYSATRSRGNLHRWMPTRRRRSGFRQSVATVWYSLSVQRPTHEIFIPTVKKDSDLFCYTIIMVAFNTIFSLRLSRATISLPFRRPTTRRSRTPSTGSNDIIIHFRDDRRKKKNTIVSGTYWFLILRFELCIIYCG